MDCSRRPHSFSSTYMRGSSLPDGSDAFHSATIVLHLVLHNSDTSSASSFPIPPYPKDRRRLPTVLSREEASRLISYSGIPRLASSLSRFDHTRTFALGNSLSTHGIQNAIPIPEKFHAADEFGFQPWRSHSSPLHL